MADQPSLPRPITTGEQFLAAILDELRAMRRERAQATQDLTTFDTPPETDRLQEGRRRRK